MVQSSFGQFSAAGTKAKESYGEGGVVWQPTNPIQWQLKSNKIGFETQRKARACPSFLAPRFNKMSDEDKKRFIEAVTGAGGKIDSKAAAALIAAAASGGDPEIANKVKKSFRKKY